MKKTLLAVVLSAASLPLTFAADKAKTPEQPAAASDQATAKPKHKKHVKKNVKKSVETNTNATTPAAPATPKK